MTEHRIRWYVVVDRTPETPDGLLPRTRGMRGLWGYEVKCSCGQESHTGGGTMRWLREKVWEHVRFEVPL